MKNGTQNKVDIAVLQERAHSIDNRLEKIETNDLPHIHDKLHAMDKRMAYYSGGIVVLLGVLELLLKLY